MYFQLGLIVGDKLGMHLILGSFESFSVCHPCKFCLIHRNDINTTFHESSCTLRDETNYAQHLEDSAVKTTGIKESCCFNILEGFQVTKNLAVDAMP